MTAGAAGVRERWRSLRLPVLVGAGIVVLAVLAALVEGGPAPRPLDPRDPSPVGAHALAALLRDRGVQVVPVAAATGLARGAGVVLVPTPYALSSAQLRALAGTRAAVVVVAPTDRELSALRIPARTAGASSGTAAPGCRWPAATTAGTVEVEGTAYQPGAGMTACYRRPDGAGAVLVRTASPARVVLGSPTTFDDAHLAHEGNAALALGVLSGHGTVRWLLPHRPIEAAGPRRGVVELLPAGVRWGAVAALLALLVTAAWRARRLGPVVPEPLPVVVRAAETVEGRARLLHAAGARGRAADDLRAAARRRLRAALGLPAGTPDEALVAAVAERTGRPGADLAPLLTGPAPSGDAALVRLADALDELERSALTPSPPTAVAEVRP